MEKRTMMKKSYQGVKGTTDFYPEDKAVQNAIFDVMRTTAQRFGFQEIESPAMESTALLTAKSGEEIKQQLFVLEKKGTEELALRFDLTVPFTRMFVAKEREIPKPVKWFGINRMWRYEAPQKGRLREFFQLSVELFGSPYPEADAEIITLAIAVLESLGLGSDDVYVRINNRVLLEGLLADALPGKAIEPIVRIIDKSSRLAPKEVEVELSNAGLLQKEIDRVMAIVAVKGTPAEAIPRIEKMKLNTEAKKGLDDLNAVIALLPQEYAVVDLAQARGLAYYTGTVFEIFDREGELRAIAGGGRYDKLVELFGGSPTPATGFGMGYSTLKLLLEKKKMLPAVKKGPEYVIAPVTAQQIPAARAVAAALRKKGVADIDLMRRKLGKQLEYAISIGAKNMVFLGPDEEALKEVKIRNLETGKEAIKKWSELEEKDESLTERVA